MMLSENTLNCLNALGVEVSGVQGRTIEKVVQGSAMKRHTEIPIAGNTESHQNYNELLRRIKRHNQFEIPIPDELIAELARIAGELVANSNVEYVKSTAQPKAEPGMQKVNARMANTRLAGFGAGDDIGKTKYRMHGLESGATMPRIGKPKY